MAPVCGRGPTHAGPPRLRQLQSGVLIAIEGVDGAGKRTLTDGLRSSFVAAGLSVAGLAFPRYHRSIHADLAAEALHGEHGDLASSVYAMATLFALDRSHARSEIAELSDAHDVVILDRYVASNAAYSAARLQQPADPSRLSWLPPAPATGRLRRLTGPATPMNETPICRKGLAPPTPGWPPPSGAAGGPSPAQTSWRVIWPPCYSADLRRKRPGQVPRIIAFQ
jgi:hypothetical protein